MNYETINDAVTMKGAAAGHYRDVRQLGLGGMSLVWLAQLDGKRFDIKMLPSILVVNNRVCRQLKDEVRGYYTVVRNLVCELAAKQLEGLLSAT